MQLSEIMLQLRPSPSVCGGMEWGVPSSTAKSDSVFLEWDLETCVSNRLTGETSSTGPRSTHNSKALAFQGLPCALFNEDFVTPCELSSAAGVTFFYI